MPLAICSMCFKRKDCSQVYPETEPVCRGCFMDLDRATGWLEHGGWGLIHGATGRILGIEGVQERQDGAAIEPRPKAIDPVASSHGDDNPLDPPAGPVEPPVTVPPRAKAK